MEQHVFVGFGFGPIQGGLFVKEAFQSGNFQRIVLAEIDAHLVEAVRANRGAYHVNVARADGVEQLTIEDVELLNPTQPEDAAALRSALAQATEIATCLPSVNFYDTGQANAVAALIAEAIASRPSGPTIVYAAENHNHAAEILQGCVTDKRSAPLPARIQFLNTVIGKMSRVVDEPAEIAERSLAPIAPGLDRAFLVEAFNRILVTRTAIADFRPGIEVFVEKADLLPFEEAKLYGHNAIHALLGFVGGLGGHVTMTELKDDTALMAAARVAFLDESGAALIRKYASLHDELFAEAGYQRYAEDLLERITNPYLGDTVARAGRDIMRKLGGADRIFGTMALALEHGIAPKAMALGAMAGVALLLQNPTQTTVPADLRSLDWQRMDIDCLTRLLQVIWHGQEPARADQLIETTWRAKERLRDLVTH